MSTPTPPVLFTWDGDHMAPVHPRIADRHFVVDQRYALVEYQPRSVASHNHEFAWLARAWKSLPERLADQFPSPEHLRKRALIDAGFYVQSQVDAGSHAAALRFAAFMQADDVFAAAVVRDSIAIKRVAESQSRHAMGPQRFQESKAAILEVVSNLIGVTTGDLRRAA